MNEWQSELTAAQAESARLAAELATERAISARFLREHDEGVSTAQATSTRLKGELDTQLEITARLMAERDELRRQCDGTRNRMVLSSYLGDYTSEFLSARTPSQRATLLEDIKSTVTKIWNSGAGLSWAATIQVIRTMMAHHGFVFREPGEGQIGWGGYATMVPNIPTVEQLDRVVRTHRDELNATGWYLNELTAVLLRVTQYLQSNP